MPKKDEIQADLDKALAKIAELEAAAAAELVELPLDESIAALEGKL